jgi:ribokinase
MAKEGVAILGIYVADLAFTAKRQPIMGETLLGAKFAMGPGGKGSNQSVAAARAGGKVTFISKVGKDNFGDAALAMYAREGIVAKVEQLSDASTGAAYIFLEQGTGNNAIIVVPGAADRITVADVEKSADVIRNSRVFMTQLEVPLSAGMRALEIARDAGTTTILNTAPFVPIDDAMLRLADFATPNESEASALTGIEVKDLDTARKAADLLLEKGAATALITLGAQGSLLHSASVSTHIPAFGAGPVIDTTGAGDAFNGGFATALSLGMVPQDAARFGSATAGISVTRPGTAPSMPKREEILKLLAISA